MIYNISENDVVTLEKLISKTKKFPNKRSIELTDSQEHIYEHRDTTLPNIEIEYYSTKNEVLNQAFSEILGVKNETPLTIHTFKYHVGAYSKKHRDTNSYNTFVIILEDDFKGGDFYLNDKLTKFGKRGDVANYIGHEERHSVTPITEGIRTVLVVWYAPLRQSFI